MTATRTSCVWWAWPGAGGRQGAGIVVCTSRGCRAGPRTVPVPAPRLCEREHVCADSSTTAGGENHINSRLRIKQYLWAIVIKGRFNSLLMPHYAGLCEVTPGSCHRFNGTGGYREREGRRVVLGLPAPGPPGGRGGPLGRRLSVVSDLVSTPRARCAAAWCVLGQLWVLMWPLPALQEVLVPPPQSVGPPQKRKRGSDISCRSRAQALGRKPFVPLASQRGVGVQEDLCPEGIRPVCRDR